MKRNALKTFSLTLVILSTAIQATVAHALPRRDQGKALRPVSHVVPARSTASAARQGVQSFQFRLVFENKWSQFRLENEQGAWNLRYVSNFEKTRILRLKPQQAESLLSEAGRTLVSEESISRCSNSYLQLQVNPTISSQSKTLSYACWNSTSSNGKQANELFDSLARTLQTGKNRQSGRI